MAMVSQASGRPPGYPVSRGSVYSIMAQPYRYIVNSDGGEELFELNSDPGEASNVLDATAVDVRTRLKARAATLLRQQRAELHASAGSGGKNEL